MAVSRNRHIIGLDLLRLVAATLVMVYHFGFWNWVREEPLARMLPGQTPAWGADVHFGWVGVEIFFVISGFVIAYTASSADPARFLRARFLRLAPASWIGATIALLVFAALHHALDKLVIVKYLKTLIFWPLDAIDGVWWTIGIEIDFYILVYVLIRARLIGSLGTVAVTLGLASGMFWVLALSAQYYLQGADGFRGVLYHLVAKAEGNRELQLLLVQHGCLFGLGVTFWQASTRGLTKRRFVAILALVGACILEIVGQDGIIARNAGLPLSAIPAIVTWGAAAGFLVLSMAFDEQLVRLIGRGAWIVRFMGLATYPLYLVHDAIGTLVIDNAWANVRNINIAIACGILAAFGAAGIIAAVIEPWLRGVLSKLWPTSRGLLPQT